MLTAICTANLGLRFTLELCALAALAYWGVRTGGSTPAKIALAVGAPLLAAVVWGTFVSPNATISTSGTVRTLLQFAVFGSAAAALLAVNRPALAGMLGLTALINGVLLTASPQ